MKLIPYPKYKDSGVSWIGRIPAHWSEKRAKYYFKEIDERSQIGDEEMLSVSHITGVTPRHQKNVTMFKAESNVGQKLCQPGDLVINTMWAWMAALGVSNYTGIVSPAYGVYRLLNSEDYDYYYLDHLLRVEGYRSEYICRSTGIRSSRLRLYPDKFLSMRVICPPQSEQKIISRFLKAQDRLFWKFIRNKRRLIELLKEQVEGLAFGGQSYGCVNKYDDWKKLFPEHWEFQKAKRVFSESSIKNTTNKELLAVTQDRGVLPKRMCSQNYVSPAGSLAGLKLVQIHDYVISLRSFQGGIEFSEFEGIVSPAYTVLSLKDEFRNEPLMIFYRTLFKSKNFILLLNTVISGIRDGKNISFSDFCELELPIPPVEELEELILQFQKQQNIQKLFENEKILIEEYRARLISDVVTGKVDVRGIEVPEIAEEELLFLDEDNTDADEIIDEEEVMDETY